jgi:Predicted metal-dependent phosphoesterases (PHP family)
MKSEMYFYSITPRILNINKPTELTVKPLDTRYNFTSDIEYEVEILPMTRYGITTTVISKVCTAKICGDKLIFSHTFDKEEEYYIRIFNKANHERIIQLSVYALEDDLYARRPLKGDLHVHSCRSDGQETPPVVAANYRAAGFDFMGLTDHRRFFPSIEAIDAYKDVELGMQLFTGEEIHTPDNIVHYVQFGGNFSINEIYQKNESLFRREVDEIIAAEEIPYHDKFMYASGMWIANKIKESGGLSIFAHPHWISNVYNVPDDLSIALLKNNVFDAFEVIGGQTANENNMQTAMYYQLRAEGYKIPIVGSSDSHGTINRGLFDKMYTIVFSDDDILGSIRDLHSVAIEVYEDSVNYTVHGTYRLVSYARFLIENYFKFTAQFCAEEGLLMRQYLLGIEGAKERLNAIKSRTDDFYKLCAGK